MSVNDVRRYFSEKGIEDTIIEFSESTATVELAAKALGVDPGLIAKTLAFRVNDSNILIVAQGDARIDNKKYKEVFKTKAKMTSPLEVEEVIGHPVGGLCPFGLKQAFDIYLDVSLKKFDYVFPAAGSRNTALKITPERLQALTKGLWIDVCGAVIEKGLQV